MSLTKTYIDDQMAQGNDVLHTEIPDDTDIDYQAKHQGYYEQRCPHDYSEVLTNGGRVCIHCGDYVSPEDILNSFREMEEDDKRGGSDANS